MVLCCFRPAKRITSFTRFGAFEHSSVYALGDQNVFVKNFYIHTLVICLKHSCFDFIVKSTSKS